MARVFSVTRRYPVSSRDDLASSVCPRSKCPLSFLARSGVRGSANLVACLLAAIVCRTVLVRGLDYSLCFMFPLADLNGRAGLAGQWSSL